jgi:DNA-binding MarR family transcriptional regulator
MTSRHVPAAVRRLLERAVDGVEQLEILLLLYHHAERSWNAEGVADALRLTPRVVAAHLEALAQRDLLDVRIAGEVRYRFAPATRAQTAAIVQLAAWYRDHRSSILALVSTRRRQSLQDFADAFRIREDDVDG